MNYLAHFLLAGERSGALLGGVLGDFVKGRLPEDMDAELRRGILLHRRVDSFTDAHPVTKTSRDRFSPGRRRYAGVIVDLVYDHFLARHWPRYCEEPLGAFAARVYAVLRAHESMLEGRAARLVRRMVEQDWLSAYRGVDMVAAALEGASRRLSRENPLPGAIVEVEHHYRALEADFEAFFPALVEFAAAERGEPRPATTRRARG